MIAARVECGESLAQEVDLLLGDASKAHAALSWRPKVSFPELVERMVDADLKLVAPSGA